MKKKYCPFCDITFTYNQKDIVKTEPEQDTLVCPVCKRWLFHKETDEK